MKKVSGTLKLDQAQYRELEAFAKFGSDLDAATQSVLDKGMRNVQILKQAQYSPVAVEKQVAIIHLGTKGLLKDVPVNKVMEFEEAYLTAMETQAADTLEEFRVGRLTDEGKAAAERIGAEIAKQFKS